MENKTYESVGDDMAMATPDPIMESFSRWVQEGAPVPDYEVNAKVMPEEALCELWDLNIWYYEVRDAILERRKNGQTTKGMLPFLLEHYHAQRDVIVAKYL